VSQSPIYGLWVAIAFKSKSLPKTRVLASSYNYLKCPASSRNLVLSFEPRLGCWQECSEYPYTRDRKVCLSPATPYLFRCFACKTACLSEFSPGCVPQLIKRKCCTPNSKSSFRLDLNSFLRRLLLVSL
jgi:hypothetical protein